MGLAIKIDHPYVANASKCYVTFYKADFYPTEKRGKVSMRVWMNEKARHAEGKVPLGEINIPLGEKEQMNGRTGAVAQLAFKDFWLKDRKAWYKKIKEYKCDFLGDPVDMSKAEDVLNKETKKK